MFQRDPDSLGSLNAYQIAGLAIVASTLAALGVMALLRRFGLFAHVAPPADLHEAVDDHRSNGADVPLETPRHFSEDLLVPGITHTGPEVIQADDEEGRSPEGV